LKIFIIEKFCTNIRIILAVQVKMALLKYFKREVKTHLLSPSGSLSRQIPNSGIVATNKEVATAHDGGKE